MADQEKGVEKNIEKEKGKDAAIEVDCKETGMQTGLSESEEPRRNQTLQMAPNVRHFGDCDNRYKTTTTTTTVLWPLQTSICASRHLQLITEEDFVGAKFYCPQALANGQ